MLRDADRSLRMGYNNGVQRTTPAMSEEQLTALLAKLKDDMELQEKLKGAADLDAAMAIAKDAGFDISKADWLKHQATRTLELSDGELERVAGGKNPNEDFWTHDIPTRIVRGDFCYYDDKVEPV